MSVENEDLAEETGIDSTAIEGGQEGQQQEQELEVFEIGLSGETPAPEKRGNPMVTRIIGQRDKARDRVAELEQRANQLEAQIAAQSVLQAATPPDQYSFDTDQEYQAAVIEWAKTSQAIAPAKQSTADTQSPYINSESIEKHYKRAEELASKIPNYSELESKAAEILGDTLVAELTGLSDKSPELLAFFGSNPQRAEQWKHLALSNPAAAIKEIGVLETSIELKPRNKTTPKPEADDVLTGGSQQTSAAGRSFEKRLNALRDSGDINGAIKLKKEAKAKGIDL